MTSADNLVAGLQDAIRQHADVVVAHDHVHADRGTCGGLGACALMRAEHDAEEEITDRIRLCARGKVGLTVVVTS